MAGVVTRSAGLGTYSMLKSSHCALILGWAGADDNFLKKYADLYEKRGIDSVRFTSKMKAYSAEGMKDLRDMNDIFPLLDEIQNKRLLVHIFSLNGVYSLVTLLHNSKYRDLLSKTDGVIWDSCHNNFKLWLYLTGYNQVINHFNMKVMKSGSLIDRLQCTADKTAFMSSVVMQAMRQWRHVSSGGNMSDVSTYHYLRDHPQLPTRHTFFYSIPDTIFNAEQIRAFHEYLSEKRGLEVDATCFNDSAHVKHYPTHPVEYSDGIDRMLASIQRMYNTESEYNHTDFEFKSRHSRRM